MECPACDADDPHRAGFCNGCGAALRAVCANCDHGNPPASRFCNQCGHALAPLVGVSAQAQAPAVVSPQVYTPKDLAEKILANRVALEGERKQVTVLVADIAGSRELIRDGDPQDARRVLDGAVALMIGAVHRHEGTVSRLTGNRLMAIFGAPIAHEDHAARACYAALAMLGAIRDYAAEVSQAYGSAIRIRVGLNSGEVAVRRISDDLHMDYTAVGQTVHLASRMEGLANEGTAMLSVTTQSLAEERIESRALGLTTVEGLDQPIDVYELVGAGAARARPQASAARGPTSFVGWQHQRAAIERALATAQAGSRQVVALVAEATVGRPRLAAWRSSAPWSGRALWLGALAVALGLYGQKLIVDGHLVDLATRWYAAAIVLAIVAWRGTYRNKHFVSLPCRDPSVARGTTADGPEELAEGGRRFGWPRLARWPALARAVHASPLLPRYAVALAALALNLFSTSQIRSHGYDSAIGGIGWAASLVLLLVAFVGYRPSPSRSADAGVEDVEDRTAVYLPRTAEIGIVLAIVVLGLAMRLYRLGDWTTGVHGDEGEAGADALRILEGQWVSPFRSGWFAQPNFYYWGIALTMRAFGTDLVGLRMFSTLAGTLMILPFYFLVRSWFGVRTAIIASVLLAISDVAIHFSRQEFSNITTPLFQVIGFYFLFRGLRVRRLTDFVLAAYAHMLSMYFYLGGRLTPILLAAFFAYLFVLMPLVRLAGRCRQVRRLRTDRGRLAALGEAACHEGRGVLLYAHHLVVFVLACVCLASPWLAYFADHQREWNERANEKLIFNNPDRMVAQHAATNAPLYLGLRWPNPRDPLPLPIVAEQTPISVRVAEDGFWPRVLWGQLLTTLSILTSRNDASGVYTFTQEPIAKPIEAVLTILGLAWALWRWRDTRMALLSLWFWSTTIVGGVLTIDAPYMARLVGFIPVLAIVAAIPLNKLAAELVQAFDRIGRPAIGWRAGQALSGAALAALLTLLTIQNGYDYYVRYLALWPFREASGQAAFVRWMNQQVTAEGRPLPRYYDLGAHHIYWTHGVNRFLNHGTPGGDMVNVANELPVLDNGERDVVFMVWGPNQQYLSVIKAYYPRGVEQPFHFGPAGPGGNLLTWYRVTKEQLEERRVVQASYTPATGAAIEREEAALGSSLAPPSDLAYPSQARWTGGLVAPTYGRYRFQIASSAAAELAIDGTSVVAVGNGASVAVAEVVLARGPHDVELNGTLPSADATVGVRWSTGDQPFAPIPRELLWSGPVSAMRGEVRPLADDPFGPLAAEATGPPDGTVIMRRVDGFLGFRDAPRALSNGAPLMATWTGTLTAPQAGPYQFEVFSNGGSTIAIDGDVVVDNRDVGSAPRSAVGRVDLAAGSHRYEIRYAWSGNPGYLEVYWTPPGRQKVIFRPSGPRGEGSHWPVEAEAVTENASAQHGDRPTAVAAVPAATLELGSQVNAPRGLAVDADGSIYVADSENHRVAVFDGDGKLLQAWGGEGSRDGEFALTEDLAIGPDGKIYVLDSDLPRVQVFSPMGKLERIVGGEPGWCRPAGFTVAPDNSIYVADTCHSRIQAYSSFGDPEGEYSGGADAETRLEQPVDVAIGGDGAIYVADLRDRIVKIDPKTDAILQSWMVHVGRARGAANLTMVGSTLYLTDPDRNALAVIDTASGHIAQVGSSDSGPWQFGVPVGVAVDPYGRIQVLDSNNGRIQVFDGLDPS